MNHVRHPIPRSRCPTQVNCRWKPNAPRPGRDTGSPHLSSPKGNRFSAPSLRARRVNGKVVESIALSALLEGVSESISTSNPASPPTSSAGRDSGPIRDFPSPSGNTARESGKGRRDSDKTGVSTGGGDGANGSEAVANGSRAVANGPNLGRDRTSLAGGKQEETVCVVGAESWTVDGEATTTTTTPSTAAKEQRYWARRNDSSPSPPGDLDGDPAVASVAGIGTHREEVSAGDDQSSAVKMNGGDPLAAEGVSDGGDEGSGADLGVTGRDGCAGAGEGCRPQDTGEDFPYRRPEFEVKMCLSLYKVSRRKLKNKSKASGGVRCVFFLRTVSSSIDMSGVRGRSRIKRHWKMGARGIGVGGASTLRCLINIT